MEQSKLLQLSKINYQTYYERRLFVQNKERIAFVPFEDQVSETKDMWFEITTKLVSSITARLNEIDNLSFQEHLRYLALRNYEIHERKSKGSNPAITFLDLPQAQQIGWLKATEAVLRNTAKILMDIADSSGSF